MPVLQQDLLLARQITHAHRTGTEERKSQFRNMPEREDGRRAERKMGPDATRDERGIPEIRLQQRQYPYRYQQIIRMTLEGRLRQQEMKTQLNNDKEEPIQQKQQPSQIPKNNSRKTDNITCNNRNSSKKPMIRETMENNQIQKAQNKLQNERIYKSTQQQHGGKPKRDRATHRRQRKRTGRDMKETHTNRELDYRENANHEHTNQREYAPKLKQSELKPPSIIIAPPTEKEPTDQ